MGITIGRALPGHVVTTHTTTTSMTFSGGVGTGVSNTTSSDSFKPGANQWGQAGVKISFVNESDKEIKYVHFEVNALNRVNDIIGESKSLKATGPIKPHSRCEKIWTCIWDNVPSIDSVEITECRIDYMDGSSEIQVSHGDSNNRIHFDGALKYSRVLPTVLAIILALITAFSTILRSIREAQYWNYYFTLPIDPWFLFAAVVLLVYAVYILSYRYKSKTAAMILCCLVLGCVIIGAYNALTNHRLIIPVYSSWENKVAPTISNMLKYSSSLGTVFMSFLLLLSNTGVFKTYKTRHHINTIAVCLLGVMLVGIAVYCILNAISHGIDWAICLIMPMIDILLWIYIWSVSIRCRSEYYKLTVMI